MNWRRWRAACTRLAGGAGILLFLALWHLGSLVYNPVVLPSPWATALALAALVAEGQVAAAALATALHALGGFGAAVLLGSVLGAAAGINACVRRLVWPVVTILQGIPPIAWIVLALLWFGMGGGTPVFTVAAATLPIVFVGTLAVASLIDNHPDVVAALQEGLAEAVEWANQHPQEAAQLGAPYLGGLQEPIIAQALPQMPLEMVPAAAARDDLQFFFTRLKELSPAVIGGDLPDDAFYYG